MVNVGIDLDGCITDSDVVWNQYMRQGHCGTPHSVSHDVAPRWDYYQDICEQCFDDCLTLDDVVMAHTPRWDALETLGLLGEDESIALHLITSRPKQTTSATLRWLARWGLTPLFETITVTDDKVKVCNDLDILFHVDDAPHNLDALMGSETYAVAFDRPWNRKSDCDFRISWWDVGDFYDILDDIESQE